MVSDTGKHPSPPRRRQRLAATIIFVFCALALAFIPVAAARPDHIRQLPGAPAPDQRGAPQTGTPGTGAPQTSTPAKAVVPSHPQRHGRTEDCCAAQPAPGSAGTPNKQPERATGNEPHDSGDPIGPPRAGRVAPPAGGHRQDSGNHQEHHPGNHQRENPGNTGETVGANGKPGSELKPPEDSSPSHVPSGNAKRSKSSLQVKSPRQPAVSSAASGRPTAISAPAVAANTPVPSTTTPPAVAAPPTAATPQQQVINTSRPPVTGRSPHAARGRRHAHSPVATRRATPAASSREESRP